MNGYSRIKKISTSGSKSVDFGDVSFQDHTPRSKPSRSKPSPQDKSQIEFHETKVKPTIAMPPASIPKDESGEAFGTIFDREYQVFSSSSRKLTPLQKMGSVSSATYKTAMAKQQKSSSFHSVLKSTISIKRSASVSEGYSRIQNQSDLAREGSDKPETSEASLRTNMKRKAKFLKEMEFSCFDRLRETAGE